jgi:hypothetical protein
MWMGRSFLCVVLTFTVLVLESGVAEAGVTSLSQGSQRLHRPMLNRFQIGEDKAVLNVRVAR